MVRKTEKDKQALTALAGEYVTGVLDAGERLEVERMAASEQDVADAIKGWETRLAPLNDRYEAVAPPASVKRALDARLFNSAAQTAVGGRGLWNAIGFWRAAGLVASVAFVAMGIYNTRLLTDLETARSQLQIVEADKEGLSARIAELDNRLAESGVQVAQGTEELQVARAMLAELRDEMAELRQKQRPVLVVSLESGETNYRFLALHEEGTDNVRMTLVSGEPVNERDFELWLVEPERDTVSLGVIESGRSAVELSPEQISILQSGGLLAVSLEQPGGSPTGVAEGPIVAVGSPHEL